MDNLSSNARAVLDALTALGAGGIADIREITGKAVSTTEKAMRELAAAGLVIEVPAGTDDPADTPTRWHLATEQAAASTDTTTIDQPDHGEPTNPDQGDGESDPAGPAPTVRKPVDRKVLIIAGVLGDYPDGTTVDVVADACGLGVLTVARYLAAMAAVDAARRIPANPDAGTPERWAPGQGRVSDVAPNPAPERCPTCGQVIRATRSFAGLDRTTRDPSPLNSDGSEPFGRGVLRSMVLDFINAHPGHTFTPQDIATELSNRHQRAISNGAVRNNCTTLAAAGQLQLASEVPLAFTANPATPAA
jgi:hypothetical protein